MKSVSILDLPSQEPCRVEIDSLGEWFARDGVIVFPDCLGESERGPLRQALNDHFRPMRERALELCNAGDKEFTAKYACDVISWDPVKEKNPAFVQLVQSPFLREVTEAVIGPGFSEPYSMVMFSVGGGRGQAWHQDCLYGAGVGFNLNRLFYADDLSMEDGAIVVVPGSHRRGTIPPGGHQEAMAGEVVLTPRAGTLVLLHGLVYHRVTPNLTPEPRISINFRAFPSGVTQDVTCFGVYRNGTVNFCDPSKNHVAPASPGQDTAQAVMR